MLDPASPQLISLLAELHICSAIELQRCGRFVRHLASDLPAFDSVWIDALVQARRLTPYQAELLNSDQPRQILLGSSVLIDRLGGGSGSETFLARNIEARDQYVLKRLFGEFFPLEDCRQRLKEVVVACRGLAHPALSPPVGYESSERGLLIHSRYIPGFHLGQLLIRRGRYPARVVWEIARQLLEGLAELHRRGVVHGEVRMENIRLMDSGQVVLVDVGLRNAVEPELIPHSQVPPETYDTIAPELIGTGRFVEAAADLYALGCVLWQLLAGRPPFPTGDPLAKLVAHQTRRIEDVREWAPETPPKLAELILSLTHPEPRQRPPTAVSLLSQFLEKPVVGKKRLARFLARFKAPSAGGAIDDPEFQVNLQSWGMLLLFLALGLGVILSDHDSRLNLAEFVTNLFRKDSATSREVKVVEQTNPVSGSIDLSDDPASTSPAPETAAFQSLPDPDERGIVELAHPGPYLARDYHNIVGPLTIRSSHRERARIIVSDGAHPLSVTATDLTLEGVQLEFNPQSSPTNSSILLKVRSQSLTLRHSRCLMNFSTAETPAPAGWRSAIAWKGIDSRPDGNRLSMQDCELLGDGSGIHLDGAIHRLEFHNVLKTGPGHLCNLSEGLKPSLQSALLERVTCRDISGLFRFQGTWLDRLSAQRKKFSVELNGCVLSVLPKEGAFIEMIASELPDRWNQIIEIIGENSLAAKGLTLVNWRRSPGEHPENPPGVDDLLLEGLMVGDLKFAGNSLQNPADSAITRQSSVSLTSSSSGLGYRPVQVKTAQNGGQLQAN